MGMHLLRVLFVQTSLVDEMFNQVFQSALLLYGKLGKIGVKKLEQLIRTTNHNWINI